MPPQFAIDFTEIWYILDPSRGLGYVLPSVCG